MPELYLFLAALLLIVLIVGRRHIVFHGEEKRRFKKRISEKVEEIRAQAQEEDLPRFKDALSKEKERQKFNLAKFKDEMRKAEMAMAKKQWKEAKKHLIQAMSLAKDEYLVAVKLARVYQESGDHRRAESLYRRLLEDGIASAEIYANLGKIFTHKKRYKEAIRAYVQAVELNEKDDQLLLALGKLYQLLMRYSLAGECFRRAAELKPREVDYLFLLAESCEADEDLDNALFTYEKILTLEPYNERAREGAQNIRLKIKEFETFLIGQTT